MASQRLPLFAESLSQLQHPIVTVAVFASPEDDPAYPTYDDQRASANGSRPSPPSHQATIIDVEAAARFGNFDNQLQPPEPPRLEQLARIGPVQQPEFLDYAGRMAADGRGRRYLTLVPGLLEGPPTTPQSPHRITDSL